MINPVREIYEMEFRQHDLAKEIDHLRRVKAATGSQGAYLPSLWARIRHGWHVLAQISKIRVEVSFDLREPSESPSR